MVALSVLFRASGSQCSAWYIGKQSNRTRGVAGGFSEGAMILGLATLVVSEIAAIVLLAGSFSRGHSLRGFLSVVSMGCALFVVALLGLLVCFISHSLSFFR